MWHLVALEVGLPLGAYARADLVALPSTNKDII